MRLSLAATALAIAIVLAAATGAHADDFVPSDPPQDYQSPPQLEDTQSGNQLLNATQDGQISSDQSSGAGAKDWSNQNFDGYDNTLPPSSDDLEPKPFSATPNE